jgi:hypothetical protein
MKLPLRFILPLVIAIAIIIASIIYLNTDFTLNKGAEDITYNDVVYERFELDYNITITEEHAKKIGTYGQPGAYGQEWIYDVYQLNDEAIFLYTPHADFVKSGCPQPSIFGEEFTYVEYVVSEGHDFVGMPDDYTEEATLLDNFDKSVKLEDVIETEPTDINVGMDVIRECNEIRFKFKNYPDMFAMFYIYGVDGDYYLGIGYDYDVEQDIEYVRWHKINPEYVDLLTSKM